MEKIVIQLLKNFVAVMATLSASAGAVPFLSSPDFTAYPGINTKAAGDINNDGYMDMVCGYDQYSNGFYTEAGRCYLYLGGPNGLYGPVWEWSPQRTKAFAGTPIGGGDINGDGYGDIVVEAPYLSNGQTEEGGIFVFYGKATGFDAAPNWQAESNMTQIWSSVAPKAKAALADVNADGYSDVIYAAYGYENVSGQTGQGLVMVFYGSSSGLGPNGTPANADWKLAGNEAYQYVGIRVGNAGDVNGDGKEDFFICDSANNTQIYFGSTTGPGVPDQVLHGATTPGVRFPLAQPGDVNGDGYDDLLFKWRLPVAGSKGAVSLLLGSSEGVTTTPVWTSAGSILNYDDFMYPTSASAADVDLNGHMDVLIGGDYERQLYISGPSGLPSTPQMTSKSPLPMPQYPGLDYTVMSDFNGDNKPEVICGGMFRHGYSMFGYWSRRSSISVTSGKEVSFNDLDIDATRTISVSAMSVGLDNLEFSGVRAEIVGPDAADFSIEAVPTSSPLSIFETVDIPVTFHPDTLGSKTATLRLHTNDDITSVVDVSLSGFGIDPDLEIAPTSIDFSNVSVTEQPLSQSFTLSNKGVTELSFIGIGLGISGPAAAEYRLDDNISTGSLQPGESRHYNVWFDPDSSGVKAASVEVITNDHTQSEAIIGLNGYCLAAHLSLSDEVIRFAHLGLQDPAVTRRLRIQNAGSIPLEFTSVPLSITGPDYTDYEITSFPEIPLAPGDIREVDITFRPTDFGKREISLSVNATNAVEGPMQIPIVGLGGRLSAFPNPTLWLKASDGPLLQDNKVKLWADASGNGHHAVQETSVNRPTSVTVSGHVRVNTPSGTWMDNYSLALDPSMTIFACASPARVASRTRLINNERNFSVGCLVGFGGPVQYTDVRYGNGTTWNMVHTPNMSQPLNSVFGAVNHGTTSTIYINGRKGPETINPMAAFSNGYTIANTQGATSALEPWGGTVDEILMFDRALDENELGAVQIYLAGTYQLGASTTANWTLSAGATGTYTCGGTGCVVHIASNTGAASDFATSRTEGQLAGPISGGESARSPGGSIVEPDTFVGNIYWTIRATGNPAVSGSIAIDANFLPPGTDWDKLVILKRPDASTVWVPQDTVRVDNWLVCQDVTSFSDFAIGKKADISEISDWTLY